METLTLVIPAYNEEKRLPRTFGLLQKAIQEGVFNAYDLKEILIVDDGSQDQTINVTNEYHSSITLIRLIQVKPNQGKGNAIHVGLKEAQGDWCLIADADSATPWDQLLTLHKACVTSATSESVQVAIASRDMPESELRVQQSWIREHMGKAFNFMVRMITGLPFKDTQCGFKLIHRASIQNFLTDFRVKRFAWDVEFLMFARTFGLKIVEVPVVWEHQDESRVNPIKDSAEMLLRVIQMRLRLFFIKFNQ